jgi:AcrR family transcriptional regulator
MKMETRKERIINSAKELFAEKGFSATGLREIAQRADVSLGNIYNYFKSKEEIFNAIFDAQEITGFLAESFEEIVDNFPFNIDRAILSVKRVVDDNIELYRLAFIDLIEFGGRYTNRMLEHIINFGKSYFQEKLTQQALAGKLKNLDYDFFTNFFMFSMITFFSISNILPALKVKNYSDEELSDMIAQVVLNGIRR